MSNLSKIALIREMIDSAESSLRSAKALLTDVAGGTPAGAAKAGYAKAASGLQNEVSEEGKIVEGVFDGQKMIGPDKEEYPVPANYASKSKLVPGDVLKLTITNEGSFIYKQIGPCERIRVKGPLIEEDGQYKVIANGRAYKILLASVTFYRAEAGDEVVLLVPENGDAEWGAVDNVVPKLQAEMEAEEAIMKEAGETAKKASDDEEISLGSLDEES